MAKPSRGRRSSPSGSSSSRSRSRSFSGSDSSSRSRSRDRSFSSSSPSRSPPPQRKSSAEVAKRGRSPPARKASPPPRKASPIRESLILHVDSLSRNVHEGHLKEIFSNYGEVVHVDLAMDRAVNLPKGFGYIEFKARADAEKALLYMDGAQIDGNVVRLRFTLPPRQNVSPREKPVVTAPKRDLLKTDRASADIEKDGPKRLREPSPQRRSPVTRRGASPRRMPVSPPRRRVDSPGRPRARSPFRRGETPPRRRPASPGRGRSSSPPPKRYRSPPRFATFCWNF
ncbi:Serine/arginine-rich splicing factor SR45 [Linum perenne]